MPSGKTNRAAPSEKVHILHAHGQGDIEGRGVRSGELRDDAGVDVFKFPLKFLALR